MEAFFSGTVKPIVSLPMVVRYGRLGGRWFDSAGRFVFFCFLAKLLFWGAQRRAARDFGGAGKATDGSHLPVAIAQKPRSWRGNPPVLHVHQRHSGAFFGRTGRFEPPHVT